MGIRKAKISDWKDISRLLVQLGYPGTEPFMEDKLERLLRHPDEEVLVYEYEGEAVGIISLHFIPQIALEGDFARISYFVIDEAMRQKGIGREIESYCVELANARKCDRIEVHSHARRTGAHAFYDRQGYTESPKYLIKKLKE